MTPLRHWLRARSSLPRDAWVLATISFCVAVGFGVVLPVLPVYASSFGVGHTEVGVIVASFALLRLLTSPAVGPLVTRFGERTVLGVGITVVAVSSLACGLAGTYPELLAARALGGIGSAMFSVSAMTLLLRSVPSRLRGRAAGLFQGGFLIGTMTGPVVGGVLATISLRAPFWFYAGTLVVAAVVGLTLLHAPRTELAERNAARGLGAVVRDPRYQTALVAGLGTGWNSIGVRGALVPLVVTESLHRPPSWTGLLFAVMAVVQTVALPFAGRFVDEVGRRPAILGAGLLGAAAIVAVPLAPSFGWLTVAGGCYAVAASFLGTAPSAAVGDATGGRSGTPVALYSMTTDLGAVVGPVVAGWLSDSVSMPAAFVVGALILLAAAASSTRMPRGREPEPA